MPDHERRKRRRVGRVTRSLSPSVAIVDPFVVRKCKICNQILSWKTQGDRRGDWCTGCWAKRKDKRKERYSQKSKPQEKLSRRNQETSQSFGEPSSSKVESDSIADSLNISGVNLAASEPPSSSHSWGPSALHTPEAAFPLSNFPSLPSGNPSQRPDAGQVSLFNPYLQPDASAPPASLQSNDLLEFSFFPAVARSSPHTPYTPYTPGLTHSGSTPSDFSSRQPSDSFLAAPRPLLFTQQPTRHDYRSVLSTPLSEFDGYNQLTDSDANRWGQPSVFSSNTVSGTLHSPFKLVAARLLPESTVGQYDAADTNVEEGHGRRRSEPSTLRESTSWVGPVPRRVVSYDHGEPSGSGFGRNVKSHGEHSVESFNSILNGPTDFPKMLDLQESFPPVTYTTSAQLQGFSEFAELDLVPPTLASQAALSQTTLSQAYNLAPSFVDGCDRDISIWQKDPQDVLPNVLGPQSMSSEHDTGSLIHDGHLRDNTDHGYT